MENSRSPLVSCLCITSNRSEQLQRAINCFEKQTYSNKELVVVYQDDDPKTREVLSATHIGDIHGFEIPATVKMSLGNKRNFAISKSNGEYICQWDDDDWYHERRIEMQLTSAIENHKAACYLAYELMYDIVDNRSFLSTIGPWPNTILCKKSVMQDIVRYPDLSRHEDREVLTNLISHRYVFPLIMPSLYIYTYHGSNTFGKDHFHLLFSRSQPLSDQITEVFRSIFASEVSNADACRMLMSPEILNNVDYFYGLNLG